MNILVTGRGGKSGSWQVRGEQLGRAIGATVLPGAIDIDSFDVAVVVKRTPTDLIARIHRAGVPLVYDVVDGWPQPTGNGWDRDQCMEWMRGQVLTVRPHALVAATRAMAIDCEHAFGVPVLALPHHARPGLARTPVRPLRVVGYEGSTDHLGNWWPWLEAECSRRGLEFRVNPASLNDLDIVVALRDINGYGPQRWKSNQKLANAQASGTPIICAREAGYIETASGAEQWANTREEVRQALDKLTPTETRLDVVKQMVPAAPQIDSVATTYLAWLRERVAK